MANMPEYTNSKTELLQQIGAEVLAQLPAYYFTNATLEIAIHPLSVIRPTCVGATDYV